jgi:hypothetical protein
MSDIEVRDERRPRLPIVKQSGELPTTHLGSFAQTDGPAAPADESICGDVLAAARGQLQRLAGGAKVSLEKSIRIEAMLGAISYCYIKGVFESDEIERRLWQDRAFLATFGNELPTALKIRNFRRDHRPAILAIIENAVSRFQERRSGGDSTNASETAHIKAEQLLNMANWMDQVN